MNYQKVYDQIIDRARKEVRAKKQGTYFERHHIIPKCLGGLDVADNAVLLTAKEHFVCHHLLVKIYPTNHKIAFALWCMCAMRNNLNKEKRYVPSSRVYEEARHLISITTMGLSKTQEHCSNISKALQGKTNYRKGISGSFSEESLRKNKMNQKNRREISQLSQQGIVIKTWDSISDAVREYGVGVSHCLMGRQKTTKGYIWKYNSEEPPMSRIGGKKSAKTN